MLGTTRDVRLCRGILSRRQRNQKENDRQGNCNHKPCSQNVSVDGECPRPELFVVNVTACKNFPGALIALTNFLKGAMQNEEIPAIHGIGIT